MHTRAHHKITDQHYAVSVNFLICVIKEYNFVFMHALLWGLSQSNIAFIIWLCIDNQNASVETMSAMCVNLYSAFLHDECLTYITVYYKALCVIVSSWSVHVTN